LFKEDNCIKEINWSPTQASQLLIVTDTNKCQFVNVAGEKSTFPNNKLPNIVTTAQWHPRKANVATIASMNGKEPMI